VIAVSGSNSEKLFLGAANLHFFVAGEFSASSAEKKITQPRWRLGEECEVLRSQI
jgi:hypothetical protein